MSDEREEMEQNPQRKGIRKGIYIVPSAFTIGNILCGFYAVINAVKGYQALPDAAVAMEFFDNGAKAIGYAVLLDNLDGRIARMTRTTSEFGVELDSIADVLSFGIAPAVLAYTWGYGSTPGLDRLGWAISFFFLICGALRLARFNVMARSPRFSHGEMTPKLDKRYFVGLPIPAAAGTLAALIHFTPRPVSTYSAADAHNFGLALLIGMALLAILMVSTIRYASFKEFGLRSNKPFFIIPTLSLLVAGIWFYSQWVLLALASTYAIHGPLNKLISFFGRGRRSTPKE